MNNDQQVDMVNKPIHYQTASGLQPIDVIEKFGINFHLGNAIKYILRAGKKGNKTQDLEKALWYICRELNNEGHGLYWIKENGTHGGNSAINQDKSAKETHK